MPDNGKRLSDNDMEDLSMTRIDRRGLLRGAAATAGVALASPYLARGAMAQGAGQVNIFAWAGYLFSADVSAL